MFVLVGILVLISFWPAFGMSAFGLAAAIEKHRYFQWKTQRSREHGLGLIGLREVAARSGARVVEGPYSTAKYGCLSSPLIPDLPALLASYLKVLETLQGTA